MLRTAVVLHHTAVVNKCATRESLRSQSYLLALLLTSYAATSALLMWFSSSICSKLFTCGDIRVPAWFWV
jgi:hypothetical protein